MFPNLRLIVGASIATLALVVIMGSGLFSFRDPHAGVADIPEVRRPLVQRAIVAGPADRQQVHSLAYARRNDELQRLLDLPATPARAIPPSVTESYPFNIAVPPADEDAPVATTEPPVTTGSEPRRSSAPASPPEVDTEFVPAGVTDRMPEAADGARETPTPSEAALPSPESPATAASEAAPATGPDGTPDASGATVAATGPSPEPAAATANDETSVAESPFPAIAQAPLPRIDPRSSEALDAALEVAKRLDRSRTASARSKKPLRTVRIHRAAALPPPAGPEQSPTGPLAASDFEIRSANAR